MLSIIEAAGWPIWTIIIASIISLTITIERFYSLRAALVVPKGLLAQTLQQLRRGGASRDMVTELRGHSPLGRLLAAGLRQVNASRDVMKEAIEDEAGSWRTNWSAT